MGTNNRERRRQKQLKKSKKARVMSAAAKQKPRPSFIEGLEQWRAGKIHATLIKNGDDLENITQKICSRIGVPDLILRSPKFKDSSGNEKELCDFLIFLGDEIIVFQVKHKVLSPIAEPETIIGRANSLIEKAEAQFSAFLKYRSTKAIYSGVNLSGFEVQIDFQKIAKIHFAIIVAYPGVTEFSEDKQFELIHGISNYKTKEDEIIPVHIFDVDDFEKVSLELDTIPDLLRYFSVRDLIFNNHSLGGLSELDFLALYKTRPSDVEEAISKDAKLVVLPGIWQSYLDQYGQSIVDRTSDNKVSYLVDRIIEKSKTSIGFNDSATFFL